MNVLASRDRLNRWNFFPVPDHDTGDNLALSLAPLADALSSWSSPRADRTLDAAAGMVRENAVGCSGLAFVALAEAFHEASAGKRSLGAEDFAAAFRLFADRVESAYSPAMEGTVLTVARRMAAADPAGLGLGPYLRKAAADGEAGAIATASILPEMRREGVGDAGAWAVVFLLKGALDGIRDFDRGALRRLDAREAPVEPGGDRPVAAAPGGRLFPLAIVTDSSADLPAEIVGRRRIGVLPLRLTIDGRTYRDGIDIKPAEFFRRLKDMRKSPTTSLPPLPEMLKTFGEAAREAREVLAIHLSSTFSGTFQAAQKAAGFIKGVRVTVLDSRSVSLGLGLLVKKASDLAEGGHGAEEIARQIGDLSTRLRILFTVDTLEFLHRGGRISGGKRFLGTLLNLKPILGISGGRITPVGRAFGRERLLEKMIAAVRRSIVQPVTEPMAVAHADCPETALLVRDRLQREFHPPEILMTEIGPVIGVHAGPGAWGVGYFA